MKMRVAMKVNGRAVEADIEPRVSLADFLRHELGLTGTHIGCEHGVCGACTVLVNGASARGCLMFAVQADGCEVETIEGLVAHERRFPALEAAFSEEHALQCGYCTPGMLVTLTELLRENAAPTEEEIRDAISGNLCRCTGYQPIVAATMKAAAATKAQRG